MSKTSDHATDISVLRYDDDDLHFFVDKTDDRKSEFDSLIMRKWKEAEENGLFEYVPDMNREKKLQGDHGILAQLSLDRSKKKRRPQNIVSMSQPYDPSLFNFTKISKREILFNVGNEDGNDLVAANISPLRKYHSLLITERLKSRPQLVTKYSLEKAIDALLLSNSPYLRMIFNSLCGNATVNHSHWHLYYLKYEMLLEYINVEHLRGPIFSLVDYPAKGFCLKLSYFPDRNVDSLISWTYLLIDYLHTINIPYNVSVSRARENVESNVYDDIRIYIWARKSSSGVEYNCNFVPAGCAFFGYLIVYNSEQGYGDLTEDTVTEILNDATSDCYFAVRDGILRMNLDDKIIEN